ncbi:amidase [Hoeflea sp. TYP-13]|uniref:amidase n=1 Tax=Hoeflea sp. TYP-13 TaxID=3230023 RepID=UPI0034C5C145
MNLVRTDQFNAFIDADGPIIEPRPDGPLSGRTLAVKDIFDVAGYRTGCGNPHKLAEAEPARKTAAAIQILLDAGAEFIGKTQTEELAFSLTGDNAHYPRPINPAAPDRMTGGSSSGSAAAVAGGLADMATGSDTGGSIRAPASYCGLVGLRATHGLISLEGTMPLAESFDTFGWFARDIDLYIEIAELLLPRSGAVPDRVLRLPEQEALLAGTAELNAYEAAARAAEDIIGTAAKAELSSLDIEQRYWCFRKIQSYEAWQAHGAWISAGNRNLGPGVKERFAYGKAMNDADLKRESANRQRFADEVGELIGDDGLIIMPTVPGAAPLASASFDDVQDYRERALRLLCLSGLTGHPQLTLPVASVDGAPFGLSLMGPKGSDLALLAIGREIINTIAKDGMNRWTR